jgi:hypothetical protein
MNGRANDGREKERADCLPPRLVEDMIALDALHGSVPESVDRAVLARAREHLASPRRGNAWLAAVRRTGGKKWTALGRPLVAAAATAVLLILVWNGIDMDRLTGGGRSDGRGRISEDLDGNGRVDIADAFHLARAIAGNHSLRTDWDVNQDGEVGSKDIDAIACAAVRISGRELP